MKKWLLTALAASLLAVPTTSFAQDDGEEAAEEAPADDVEEVDVESDTDLDKDDAEAGEDIEDREEMKGEDPNKIFKQDMKAPADAPSGFQTQINEFQAGFERYAKEITDYQVTVDSIVDAEYKRKVAQINSFYDAKIIL